MSYGYGGKPNPFDQRAGDGGGYGGPVGGSSGGYGAPPPRQPPPAAYGQGPRPQGEATRYNQAAMRQDNYNASNVEMAPLTQAAASFGNGDPNAILNECRSIDGEIRGIENNLNQLRMLQDRSLNEADQSSGSATSRQIDNLSADTMAMYRTLTERVRVVKSQPAAREARYAPQVNLVDRKLKDAIQKYREVESNFSRKTKDQMARQYRIVAPNASEAEVREVVENPAQAGQVFQQALMQSNRQGQARAVLSAVQDRQAALAKIEQQMIELAQLFQDMDTLIIQQDAAVTMIEQKAEMVVQDLDKGNEEIGVAVNTARKTRKKKWICLGICVAIIVVIVIIVLIYIFVIRGTNGGNNNGGKKRSIEARDVLFAGEAPVAQIYAQSKIVVPGLEEAAALTPLSRFAGASSGAAQGRSIESRYVVPESWQSGGSDAGEKRWVVTPDVAPVAAAGHGTTKREDASQVMPPEAPLVLHLSTPGNLKKDKRYVIPPLIDVEAIAQHNRHNVA